MIERSNFAIELTKADELALNAILPWSGKKWDSPPSGVISDIKEKIRGQLEAAQRKCSYCGLRLGGTSRGEIEHVAAKARFRHPEFTFTPHNLVLSCIWCNRPEKKGIKETVEVKRANYDECIFLLVHPYFDDPAEHYEWTDNTVEVLIQVRNNSAKGLFSINMFGLATPEMNEHRAAQVRMDEIKRSFPISPADSILVEEALNMKS